MELLIKPVASREDTEVEVANCIGKVKVEWWITII